MWSTLSKLKEFPVVLFSLLFTRSDLRKMLLIFNLILKQIRIILNNVSRILILSEQKLLLTSVQRESHDRSELE